jgi:hypothetical protein
LTVARKRLARWFKAANERRHALLDVTDRSPEQEAELQALTARVGAEVGRVFPPDQGLLERLEKTARDAEGN